MEPVFDLIKNAGDGAFAIDGMQRIVFWNDACERILGYKSSEVLGELCHEVIGGTAADGCTVCHGNCDAFRKRDWPRGVPTRHVVSQDKSGNELWLGVTTVAVPSCWSEMSVLIHLIRDITSHKRVESLVAQLSSEVTDLSDARTVRKTHEAGAIDITERERQILQAMSTGRTSPEIAEHLGISQSTVRNHIHSILSKLGVRNRLEAVLLSVRAGLL